MGEGRARRERKEAARRQTACGALGPEEPRYVGGSSGAVMRTEPRHGETPRHHGWFLAAGPCFVVYSSSSPLSKSEPSNSSPSSRRARRLLGGGAEPGGNSRDAGRSWRSGAQVRNSASRCSHG